jgi:hypothetical protein
MARQQSASFVLATLQGLQKGVVVAGAVASANAITIYLTAPALAAVSIAWFVVN